MKRERNSFKALFLSVDRWKIDKISIEQVSRCFRNRSVEKYFSECQRETWEMRLSWDWENPKSARSLIKDHGEAIQLPSPLRGCVMRCKERGKESDNTKGIFSYFHILSPSLDVHNIPRARKSSAAPACFACCLQSRSHHEIPHCKKANVYFRWNKWIMHPMWASPGSRPFPKVTKKCLLT